LKFSAQLPYAFTEHGVAMLSSVLKSKRAVEVNILIIRAFIKLREILASNRELAHKVEELQHEQKIQNKHINVIYRMIERLIMEPVKPKNHMGFDTSARP
jgi:phage regulator Rha-like protein